MKNPLSKFSVLGAAILILTFTSCNRKDSAEPEIAAEDNTNGLYESDDVVNFSIDVMNDKSGDMAKKTASSDRESEVYESKTVCNASITFTPKGSNPTGSILIDFGSTPKTCSDGRTRQGKVLITFTGKYGDPGKTQTITLQDYYVNGNKVEGTKTLSSSIVDTKLVTDISVIGGKVTYTDGTSFTWNSTRQRIYDYKGTPANLTDDVITVTGTANGTSRNNVVYAMTITSALTYNTSCVLSGVFMPSSGVLEIQPTGFQKRTIDYGDGSCDKKVTITVGNRSITYEVKK
jgi:hypothetical protein